MHNSFSCMFISILYMFRAVVPVIERTNCINMTSSICHSEEMTVWCAGLDETVTHPNLHIIRSSTQSNIYQMSY